MSGIKYMYYNTLLIQNKIYNVDSINFITFRFSNNLFCKLINLLILFLNIDVIHGFIKLLIS